MEVAMAPSISTYEINDFESLVNSFLAAPIDFGFDAPAIKNNDLSPSSSSEREVVSMPNLLGDLNTKADQLDRNNRQSQQPTISSDGSVHSSGSPFMANSQPNFSLTENILEPFFKSDQPVVTFPSNQHGGVAMYAFNSGVTQSNGYTNDDSKATKAEKNRSAQKRFRERQKEKLSTLQEQYDKMTEELSRLTTENQRLQQRTGVLDKLVKVSEEHILSFDQHTRSVGTLPMPTSLFKPPPKTMTAACKKHIPRTQNENELEEMKTLTPEMFIFKWKEYLKQVSSLLLDTELNSDNEESLDNISLLTCNVAWMCKHVSCLNQDTMNRVCCFNLEEGVPAMADDAHWLGVVKLLAFSPQQLADLRVVLELYQNGMQKIAGERQRIVLQAASMGNVEPSLYAWNESSNSDEQLYEKLAKNLRKQHALFLMFKCFFFGQFVTLQQFAKAAVYSYPYFPDAIAIMTTAVHGTSSIPAPQLPATKG